MAKKNVDEKEDLEFTDYMHARCRAYADAILDDADFTASLDELEVLEQKGATQHFSYGAYRVRLSRSLANLRLKLRRRRESKEYEIKSTNGFKLTQKDQAALASTDPEIIDLENRVIELEYKRDMVELAVKCIVERNSLISGLRGQANRLSHPSGHGSA